MKSVMKLGAHIANSAPDEARSILVRHKISDEAGSGPFHLEVIDFQESTLA